MLLCLVGHRLEVLNFLTKKKRKKKIKKKRKGGEMKEKREGVSGEKKECIRFTMSTKLKTKNIK